MRFLLCFRSFADHSLGVQDLSLHATWQLIGRRTKVERNRALTFHSNSRRCHDGEDYRAHASDQRIAASGLRHIVGAVSYVGETAQEVSVG